MDVLILVFQRLEYLVVEAANPAHCEYCGQLPLLVVTGVGGTNRILMPVLGRANRCLQDSAPYLFWNVGIQIEVMERLLHPLERLLGDGHVLGKLKSVQIRLFQHRPKSNRCLGAQFCRRIVAAQDRQQSIGKLVVDDSGVSCQLRGEKAVGFVDPVIGENLEQHLVSAPWPLPGGVIRHSISSLLQPDLYRLS